MIMLTIFCIATAFFSVYEADAGKVLMAISFDAHVIYLLDKFIF